MKKLVIIAHGDNVRLHGKALDAAIVEIERVNGAPVVESWVEEANDYHPEAESIERFGYGVCVRGNCDEPCGDFGGCKR